MLGRLLLNLRNCRHFKGTLSEKISAFVFLTRIQMMNYFCAGQNGVVSGSFFSFKIFGYSYYTLGYLFNDVFISDNYFFKSSSKAPIIIDCGSNIGMSVLFFKRLYPNARITAFEANPHVFELLKKNLNTNKIQNVEVHNVALFDKQGEISFYIGKDIGTLVGSINKGRDGVLELRVKAGKLSDYLKNVDSVDLIKMDVEGAEIDIINDLLSASVLGKANEYVIEYHHNIKGNNSQFSSFLQKFEVNGFDYNISAAFSNINSFQDILIHFYKK